MAWWTWKKMINQIEIDRIKTAINEAERQTSGEIRVSVAPFFWGNVHNAAKKAFVRLGMAATQDRNGVLIFLVPARRRFVILGDQGIHDKVGQEFWDQIVAAVSEKFRAGNFSEGLRLGIEELGRQLATHFPCDRVNDVNELPDEIDSGDQGPKP